MRLVCYVVILLVVSACGPTQLANKAIKKLNDEEFLKAKGLINKALEKDSLMPANLYAKSRLLTDYNSPQFYDSAYWYVNKAINEYDSLDEKAEATHRKKGFGLDSLRKQKELIDSLAFDWAFRKNTEDDLNYFLANYATAKQIPLARTKRNALAFATAKAENTYQSYNQFINKYPDAVQVGEARERYEKLYFDKSTADGKVLSYIRFLERNPDTPYRREAEQNIFDVVTSAHSVGGYQIFLKNYPESHLRSKAINYAYHVAKSTKSQKLNFSLPDSLITAKRLEPFGLIPLIESDKYGFMDTDGNIIIDPLYDSIDNDYKCRITATDYLLVEDKLVGRNSFTILDKSLERVDDLGFGLLRVKAGSYYGVIHKSGEEVTPIDYDEIKLFNGNILALKKGRKWYLKTVSGKLLVADTFDDIYEVGDVIALEIEDKISLKSPDQLLNAVDGNPLYFDYSITDFELLKDGRLWISNDKGEYILNDELEPLTADGVNKIEILPEEYILHYTDKVVFVDNEFNELLASDVEIIHSKYWLHTYKDSIAYAVQLKNKKGKVLKADTFHTYGNHFLVAHHADSLAVYTPNKRVLNEASIDPEIKLLKNNYAEYLTLISDDEILIIDSLGNNIRLDDIQGLDPLGKEFFTYNYKGKKGLISSLTGQRLIKPEYEAIGNYNKGNVSLLKNKKFGLYNSKYQLLIKSNYDKNIKRYNDSTFVVSKDEKSFFYFKDGNVFPEIGFEAINYWSDTVALIQNEEGWSFYNLKNRVQDEIIFQTFNVVELPSGERLAVVRADKKYGVYSNRKGPLVPPVYNDLIVLENGNEPIYFAEKRIPEAEFYVVIYYNHKGNIIKKQAYESKNYFRLYCDK